MLSSRRRERASTRERQRDQRHLDQGGAEQRRRTAPELLSGKTSASARIGASAVPVTSPRVEA